jgi:hypothetical protein
VWSGRVNIKEVRSTTTEENDVFILVSYYFVIKNIVYSNKNYGILILVLILIKVMITNVLGH